MHKDYDQLLHEHISVLEKKAAKLLNRPAPTIPIYDLAPSTIQAYLGSRYSNMPLKLFTADTTFLVEAHVVIGGNLAWYIDSTHVLDQDISFSTTGSRALTIGWQLGNITDPDRTYNIWNLKVGTSRGSSDLANRPLNVLPVAPPYDTVSGTFSIENIGGTDTLKCSEQGNNPYAIWDWGSVNTDFWVTFNWRAPQSIADAYLSDDPDTGPNWPFMIHCYDIGTSLPVIRFGMVFL